MHTKLITLLATAAVGLTLTSCGGGGGGGGGNVAPEADTSGSSYSGYAPDTLAGRKTEGNTVDFEFTSSNTVYVTQRLTLYSSSTGNSYTVRARSAGTYTYTRTGDNTAILNVQYKKCKSITSMSTSGIIEESDFGSYETVSLTANMTFTWTDEATCDVEYSDGTGYKNQIMQFVN